MKRNITSLIFYAVIGLAIFGFIFSLFDNAIGVFISILISLAIGAAIFGLVYFFFFKQRNSDELKKYRKAVKQSKQRYKNKKTNQTVNFKAPKQQNSLRKNKRKNAPKLRVIEGNKQKKKNKISL